MAKQEQAGQIMQDTGIYHPLHIPEWYIYDCFYSSSGELVIISAAEIVPAPQVWLIPDLPTDKEHQFRVDICTAKHTYVYRLSIPNTNKTINIRIRSDTTTTTNIANSEQILTVQPNKYPSYTNQIVMTTMVKNEDNIIGNWIDFHERLGIHKFVIYDNIGSKESLAGLSLVLADYIQSGIVILISWPYDYRLPISGISGQTTQQNHAIRAFDTADWIGLFDVDEYINIQRPDIIFDVNRSDVNNKTGLRRFLDGIAKRAHVGKSRLGGLQFANKFFYNPEDLPIDNGQFLRIPNCSQFFSIREREKCFILPNNVKIFDIHNIKVGGPLHLVPYKFGYFNHYIYLNKTDRGRNQTPWRDTTIYRYLD